MTGGAAAWWTRVGRGPRLRRLRDVVIAQLTLDTRALALLRIGLALALISDVLLRWPDAAALYADGGVVTQVADPWSRSLFPLYDVFGAPDQVRALFAVTALLGVALALGHRTRLVALLLWWLVGSLHLRNTAVLQDGDHLLHQLLLISVFLPCGARWSLDARRRPGRGPPLRRCAGPATALLVFQMMHLYMSAGLIKMRFAHWWLGDGVAYGLQADHFVTPLGVWLRSSGLPLAPLSMWTILLEVLGPLVWLLARPGSRLRSVAWFNFVALHAGIALFIHVGLFSFVCIAMWLFALPSHWLDRIERHLPRARAARRRGRAVACVPRARPLHAACLALLLYLPAAVAVADVGRRWRVSATLLRPARALTLKLMWAVFSGPRTATGWYLVEGRLADGQRLDLVAGKPLDQTRPADVLATFPNQRWRKLWVNFRKGRAVAMRQAYLQLLCRRHPDVRAVALIYMKREVRLTGAIPEAAPQRIAELRCPQPR